jgi:transcription antitermination protein NusB
MNAIPPEPRTTEPADASVPATPSAEDGGRIVEIAGKGQVNLREGIPAEPVRRGHDWSSRRQARVLAFQVLYEVDVAHHAPASVLQRLLDEEAAVSGSPADLEEVGRVAGGVPQDGIRYARDLIGGVLHNRAEIDTIIQERAPAWPLRQMSAVDRTVLRLGLYECRYQHGMVPYKVAINEAIEIAKLFGSDSLPRFVNGVLGSVVGAEGKSSR